MGLFLRGDVVIEWPGSRGLIPLQDPLENSHVISTAGNQVLIVPTELNADHKGAVAEVGAVGFRLVAHGRVLEQADASEVVSGGNQLAVLSHRNIVEVRS